MAGLIETVLEDLLEELGLEEAVASLHGLEQLHLFWQTTVYSLEEQGQEGRALGVVFLQVDLLEEDGAVHLLVVLEGPLDGLGRPVLTRSSQQVVLEGLPLVLSRRVS